MPDKMIELLATYWWIGALAFIVSLMVTPIARHIAYKAKIVDRPDDLLKPHGRPIAYLGGVAMCIGLLAGIAAYICVMPEADKHWREIFNCLGSLELRNLLHNPLWSLLSIALASLVITVMGLLDDITNLKPRQKIYWQVAAAGMLLAGGVGDKMIMVFLVYLAPIDFWTVWVVLPLSALMCIALVISACNATNLLDGLDGLCGGVTAIIAIGFLALSLLLEPYAPTGTREYDLFRIAICLSMVGTILGFLPYNIPPASIFMGDAGSMLLGFFVATMMVMFCQPEGNAPGGNPRLLLAAIVVYALPIADTGLAVVRRFIAGKSIFAGDRSHLYDQLIDRGMSVKKVVILFYILAGGAAVLGVSIVATSNTPLQGRHWLAICAVLAVIVWVIFWKLHMIKPPPKDQNKSH